MAIERPLQAERRRVDPVAEAPFYIPATQTVTRPRRTLKCDDTFIVTDSHGDIGASTGDPDGLFHADTRFLSRLELLINGEQPLLLGSNVRDDNTMLAVDLTNPDFYDGDHIILEKDIVHVARTIFLWRGNAYQRLALRNHGGRPIVLDFSLHFDSDFADLFEVRGIERPRRGTGIRKVVAPDQVLLSYHGLDGAARRTRLIFDPTPTRLAATSASYRIELAPHESKPIFLVVSCNDPGAQRPVPFLRGLLAAHRELRKATRGMTTVETSNELFNEVLCRSAADLCMLMTGTAQGRYPYAGIPWYSTTFGRDGLITALQMLWCDPSMARGVLRRLAAFQAKASDALSDAEPGKILHEMRAGEMAALGEVPFGLYYGSVDATPLFILLAGLYVERTGDEDTLIELWPAIEAALRWIDEVGDADHDGFIEYYRKTDKGLANQGWKDSHDAIFHADGRRAEGPIALAEVQGYVFAARQLAARCARRLHHDALARQLDADAQRLAERFEASFWCDELQSYALALDGAKEPCRVLTSNAGQVLFTGIARPERAKLVADGLLSPRFFSGWGIRTVARGEARYNPMSYHNGSVWPHDNSLIALGFARYGLKRAVGQVMQGLFEAATYMDLRRLPELFCGFQRERRRGPTLYPVACAPQAWASATPFSLIDAALGLEFHPQTKEIHLRNPRLPSFLDYVILRNLQVGGSSIDVKVRRHADEVSLEVLQARGQVQASVILSA
ncbi:MAG: amylo-alpha-1,6-glucosidase [Xanthobacteraceae bacterium]|nr:amylo-alpha-1,6-glucosidase [Xanthobacteraceae bacterium]